MRSLLALKASKSLSHCIERVSADFLASIEAAEAVSGESDDFPWSPNSAMQGNFEPHCCRIAGGDEAS